MKKNKKKARHVPWQALIVLVMTVLGVYFVAHPLMGAQAEMNEFDAYAETPQKAQTRRFLTMQPLEQYDLPATTVSENDVTETVDSEQTCELVATIPGEPNLKVHELTSGQVFDVTLQLPEKFVERNHYDFDFTYDLEAAQGEMVKFKASLFCEETGQTYTTDLWLLAMDDVRIGPALRGERKESLLYGYDLAEDALTVTLSAGFVDYPRRLYAEKMLGAWAETPGDDIVFVFLKHDIYPQTEVTPLQIQGWCATCEHDREHCDCGHFEAVKLNQPVEKPAESDG